MGRIFAFFFFFFCFVEILPGQNINLFLLIFNCQEVFNVHNIYTGTPSLLPVSRKIRYPIHYPGIIGECTILSFLMLWNSTPWLCTSFSGARNWCYTCEPHHDYVPGFLKLGVDVIHMSHTMICTWFSCKR